MDSSVWIAYFNGVETTETAFLDPLLGREPVAIGDLILTEVPQGVRDDADYAAALDLLGSLTIFDLPGGAMAVRAAEHCRALRRIGITFARRPTRSLQPFA